MQIAIIHDSGDVYISIPEDKFRKLLTSYSHLTPLEAFEKLINDLKKEALTK